MFNKKGVIYPAYVDPFSLRQLPIPPTNLKVAPTNQRVKWGTTEKNNFYKTYYKNYPRSLALVRAPAYEVHHIIPIKYGGTNVYSNLMPLPTDFHRKVTTWWASY